MEFERKKGMAEQHPKAVNDPVYGYGDGKYEAKTVVESAHVSEHTQMSIHTVTGNEYIFTRRGDGGYTLFNTRENLTLEFAAEDVANLSVTTGERFEYSKSGRGTEVVLIEIHDA